VLSNHEAQQCTNKLRLDVHGNRICLKQLASIG
jgi:hypothetical protein